MRCRQEARAKFARLRNDVLEKIELLEAKHSQSLADNLKKLLEGFVKFNREAIAKFEKTKSLFPIEVDLKSDAFTYKSQSTFSSDGAEVDVPPAEEADEGLMSTETLFNQDLMSLMNVVPVKKNEVCESLLLTELGLEDIELGAGTEMKKNSATIDDLLD